ncbi:MAG: acetyl-CoA C-acyltransferase, partial [Gammaproteobacteria bacterium]|nr:acetyl-CoA C-acyltransferase [Gammaproteobacteria bacterium]
MADAFIYDHVRTPRGRGRTDGALHEITPVQLAAQVLVALRERTSFDTALVDDVVLGCVTPIGEQGGNIARIAALVAGYAESVAGQQLNRFCASGLEAVNNAAAQIMGGHSNAVVAGGVESMSRVPMGTDGAAWASDPAVAWRTYFVPQGISADLLATLDGMSREELDRYALESQRRAANAWETGRFSASIAAVRNHLGETVLSQDEHVRPNTTLESLAELPPAFAKTGEAGFDAVALLRYPQVEAIRHVHTAGNSSGIVDGAAAVLLGNRRFGKRIGRAPRARVRAFA